MNETRFGIDQEAIRRLTSSLAVDQKTIDALSRAAVPDPSVFEGLRNAIRINLDAAGAASTLLNSPGLKEAIRGFQVDLAAIQRLSMNVLASQAALDKLSGAFQVNRDALDALRHGLQVDRATLAYITAEAAGAPIIADAFRAAMASRSEGPVSLPTLVELYSELPGKNRRELRDRVVAVVVALAYYIDRLYQQQGTHDAGFALAGLFVTLLFLHSGVVNALDVLEEHAGE